MSRNRSTRDRAPEGRDRRDAEIGSVANGDSGGLRLLATDDYRTLFAHSFDGVALADLEGRLLEANPAFGELLGRSVEELLSMDLFALTPERWRRRDRKALEQVLAGQASLTYDKEFLHAVGAPVAVSQRSWVVRDSFGAPLRQVILVRDRRPERRSEARLRRSEERYGNLFHFAVDAIVIHDLEGVILDANPRAVELLGGSKRELRERRLLDFAPAGSRGTLREALEHLRSDGSLRIEVDMLSATGMVFPAEVSCSLLSLDRRPVVQSYLRDISPRREVEDRLRRAVLHDSLTGLPNRIRLHERLELAIDRAARRPDYRFALLSIGLDRLGTINDSLGHPAGDRLLVEVAERLTRCLRGGDLLARLGGDEFAVLMPEVRGLIDARTAAQAFQKSLGQAFHLDGHDVFVGASVGILISDPAYRRAEECLRDVSAALYRAKAEGGRGQRVFEPDLQIRALRRFELEHALRQGLQNDELRIHFQPIVNLDHGGIEELECLVRWERPGRGLVPPGEFLPLAEDAGLIEAIDLFVLGAACAHLRAMRDTLGERSPKRLAVNISSRHFTRLELVSAVDEALGKHGLSGRGLRLEVTESSVIGDSSAALEVLARLRERQVAVALDDFGTGYASLGYLHRFPVDTLKIDRSFVSGEGKGSKIIEAVVILGHDLGMEITAEGIETESDLERVRTLGCEKGQGYFFSRPLDFPSISRLLADGPRW